MKSCPVCGDHYSERIDFCFTDGAVLLLVPSALDAPVPRSAPARAAEVSAPRLAAEPIKDEPTAPLPVAPVEPPNPSTPAPVAPAPAATSAPAAPAEATLDDAWLEGEAAAPPPPPPVREEPRKAGWVGWAAGAAVLVALGVFVLALSVTPSAPPAPTPTVVAEPTPAAPAPAEPEAPPAPEAVVEAPPEVASPAVPAPPAPAPIPSPRPREAAPAAEPTAAGVTVRNTPISAPPRPPTATVRNAPITPPVRSAAPAAPVAPSPWDAPDVAEGMLQLQSVPGGAVVRVDGRLVGKTPTQVKVPFGVHEVEFQLDGYRKEVRRPDVRTESLTVPVELVAVARLGPVRVLVGQEWEGARLLVDGTDMGVVSSATQLQLAEGLHVFELVLGSRRASQRKEVRLQDRGAVAILLAP